MVAKTSKKLIKGGSSGLASGGASEYGSAIFPGGAISQLTMNMASNASAGSNIIHANNPAQVWSSSGGGKKKKGGSVPSANAPIFMSSTEPHNVATTAAKYGGKNKSARKNKSKRKSIRKSHRNRH